jgi:hypothetical protein
MTDYVRAVSHSSAEAWFFRRQSLWVSFLKLFVHAMTITIASWGGGMLDY